MKLYKVTKWDFKIEEIEVTRLTDSSFYKPDYNGKERREAMSSTYYDHLKTWDEAKNHLIAREEEKLKQSQEKVIYYQQRIETAKSLVKS